MTIFKTQSGAVFGGYLSKSWTSRDQYINDPTAYLFSATKQERYLVRDTQYAAYSYPTYGPTFGGGYGGNHDIWVAEPFNAPTQSHSWFGHAFSLPDGIVYGQDNSKNYLSGNYNLNIEDIEVYSLLSNDPSFLESQILTSSEGRSFVSSLFSDTYGEVALLYRATEHGWQGRDFHSRADNKGPTVTIFKTNTGRIFGGYLKQSWASGATYIGDSEAFLFSVDKQEVNPVQPGAAGYAAYSYPGYGPTFGGGPGGNHDIWLGEPFNNQG